VKGFAGCSDDLGAKITEHLGRITKRTSPLVQAEVNARGKNARVVSFPEKSLSDRMILF
jgi:hypothetical protein